MMSRRILTRLLPVNHPPETLLGYLASRYTYLTHDQWFCEMVKGRVSVNDCVVCDAEFVIRGGDKLAWESGGIAEPAVDDRVTILHREERFVAVDKPGNLPVHPSGRYFDHTLTVILEERLGCRVFPVHRMDRETSGVMLMAFDGEMAHRLSASLSVGMKEYQALVHGDFPASGATADLPLGPDTTSAVRKKRRAWPDGVQTARTRFEKVRSWGAFSQVRCLPQTGRLHQIRAHLLALGYPLVGDKLYGRDENCFLEFIETGWTQALAARLLLPRQALHAARLSFLHPQTGVEMTIKASLPDLFDDFIQNH